MSDLVSIACNVFAAALFFIVLLCFLYAIHFAFAAQLVAALIAFIAALIVSRIAAFLAFMGTVIGK
jgi:hypothetical protein